MFAVARGALAEGSFNESRGAVCVCVCEKDGIQQGIGRESSNSCRYRYRYAYSSSYYNLMILSIKNDLALERISRNVP